MKKISIVGSGLVGSLLAIYLSKRGHKVNVFEQRSDLRTQSVSAGRSINLSLSNRGWNALKKVGVDKEVKEIALPMYKRTMHSIEGKISHQYYGRKNQAIFSTSRSELNKILLNNAERNGVRINFNSTCLSLNINTAEAEFKSDNKISVVKSDHIFGADGANSIVRKKLAKQLNLKNEVKFINYSYKELMIPAKKGKHLLDKESLHIWPRKRFMLIALPNLDGSFTCTLFLPTTGNNSFEALSTSKKVLDFFTKYFNDMVSVSPSLVDDFFNNPTSKLGIVDCYPWVYKDKVALLGDSAHAIVPFYGQGMNSGFEDCFILNEILNKNDFEQSFYDFQKVRKPNADAISQLSLDNFIVMRDKTSDPDFLLQKDIEHWFSNLHPDKWTPLYSMVTFTNKPYSIALDIGKKQALIMKKVLNKIDLTKNWQTKKTENLILSYLN